jgi:hypothetical protein
MDDQPGDHSLCQKRVVPDRGADVEEATVGRKRPEDLHECVFLLGFMDVPPSVTLPLTGPEVIVIDLDSVVEDMH